MASIELQIITAAAMLRKAKSQDRGLWYLTARMHENQENTKTFRSNLYHYYCYKPVLLTLLVPAYRFPLCAGGGWNPPPQLKTHLGVSDPVSFLYTYKHIPN